MSVNWVMLDANKNFVRLPGEQVLHTPDSSRISFNLQSPNKYPGKEPYTVQCSSGKSLLTSRRIIYLPSKLTQNFQSFAAPIQDLHDTRVTAPWFGPNEWVAIVRPTPGGGIPAQHASTGVELRLTFKDGGAYDFHEKYCRIKERLGQILETQRARGTDAAPNDPLVNGDAEAHLEELPRYEESVPAGSTVNTDGGEGGWRRASDGGPVVATAGGRRQSAGRSEGQSTGTSMVDGEEAAELTSSVSWVEHRGENEPEASMVGQQVRNRTHREQVANPAVPDGPPPAYEEAQAQSVAVSLEHMVEEQRIRELGQES